MLRTLLWLSLLFGADIEYRKMWLRNSLFVTLILCSEVLCYKMKVNQGIIKKGHDICLTPDTRLGNCVVIKSCPHLYELLKTRGQEPKVISFLQQSYCGMQNNSPKVCCNAHTNLTNAFVTSSPIPITSSSISSTVDDSTKGYWHMIQSSSSYPPVTSSPAPPVTSPKTSNDLNMNHSLSPSPVTSLFVSNTSTWESRNESKTQLQAKNKYALCGKSSRHTLNIIGGRNASLGDWPWMVALAYRTYFDPGPTFSCGGALISERWVLTAAHCVQYIGNMVLTSVRLGDLNLKDNNEDGASPVHIPVDKIIPHHGFSKSPVINDIALLRLKYPVTFTAQIRPICIPGKEEHRGDEFYSKKSAYVTGWGNTESGQLSDTLKEAQVDVIERDTCIKNYAGRRVLLDQRVLCASRYGQDACQGDSGGPLVLPIRASYYLIGVVSFGVGCGDSYYPGVYTKVAYFHDWIKSTTGLEI